MPDIGVLLLAAGRGTRFGPEPKLLGDLDGKPLILHVAEAAVASGLRPIVTVLGAHAPAIRAALAGLDVMVVENSSYRDGLSTSLRAGLSALPDPVTGVVVLLGDMPCVTAAHLDALAQAFRAADPRPAAIVPTSAGRRGNPVLLNRLLLAPALEGLRGDQGAGRILAERADVMEIAMDAAVGLDIDTQAALAAARWR